MFTNSTILINYRKSMYYISSVLSTLRLKKYYKKYNVYNGKSIVYIFCLYYAYCMFTILKELNKKNGILNENSFLKLFLLYEFVKQNK